MNTPAYWDGERWVVQSTSALTQSQLRRIGAWLLQVQAQRRLGFSPGPVRDELDTTIAALRAGRIVCGLSPEYKDATGQQFAPFAATVGTGKIISLGSN
jgi:hypothetical protein